MIILQPAVKLADPHICSDSKNRLNILSAIFDALVRRDLSGAFQPALAQSWQVAPDARQWIFQLRNDVQFHNGAPLSAADVIASLERACGPEVGGELGTEGVWASYLGDAKLSIIDPLSVQIVTARPMADLLDLLVAIPILPQSALGDIPDKLVGSGPYRLLSMTDEEVTLAPFSESRVRQPAFNETVTWRAVADEAARVKALLADKASIITNLSPANLDRLQTAGHQSIAHDSNMCVAFLFNLINGSASNLKLRQGINHAVNVERMISQARAGAATPLNGPLTPWHFGCDPTIPPYAYNPDKARQLIAASGYSGKLVIDAPTTLPDEAPILCQLMVEDLQAVGLDVTVKFYEDRTAYAHMVKAKGIADICCFDSSPLSTYRVLREKINSDVAGPWWQGYANAEVNQLLDQAAATIADDERQALYRKAYQMMHDDAPWIFLYRPTYHFGLEAGLDGVTVGADGLLRLEK